MNNSNVITIDEVKNNYFEFCFPYISSVLRDDGIFCYCDVEENIVRTISKYKIFDFCYNASINKNLLENINDDYIVIMFKKDIRYDSYVNIKEEFLKLIKPEGLNILKKKIIETDILLNNKIDKLWKKFIHDNDNSIGISFKLQTSHGTFILTNTLDNNKSLSTVLSKESSSSNIIKTVEYFFSNFKGFSFSGSNCMILVDKKADYWFDATRYLVEWYNNFKKGLNLHEAQGDQN